jgi:hypothetical protein
MRHRMPPQTSHYIHYDTHGICPLKMHAKEAHQHARRAAQLQAEHINLTSYSAYTLVQKVRTLEVVIQGYDSWLRRIEIEYEKRWHNMDERSALTEEHDRRQKNYRNALELAREDLRLVVDNGIQRLYKKRLEAVEWSLEACEMVFEGVVDVGLVVKLNYCLGALITQAV